MTPSLESTKHNDTRECVVEVVIELGSRFVSAGFVGDTLPRCVRSTSQGDHEPFESGLLPPSFGLGNRSLTRTERQVLFDALVIEQPLLKTLSEIYASHQSHWLSSVYTGSLSTGDCERLLVILHDIFVRCLQVLPGMCKAIVVTPGWPASSQMSILRILLNLLGVKIVSIYSTPPLLVIASGKRHGLVIDFGWECTRMTPIYDLRDISLTNSRVEYCNDYTGEELHFSIIAHLIDSKIDVNSIPNLFEVVQAFVTNEIFVDRTENILPQSQTFELSPGVLVPMSLKWKPITDMIFADASLFQAIDRVISNSPIDVRRSLWDNIILEGGISKIPGFKHRFYQELCKSTLDSKKISVRDTLGLWVGASMYGVRWLKMKGSKAGKHEEFDRTSFGSLKYRDGSIAFTRLPSEAH